MISGLADKQKVGSEQELRWVQAAAAAAIVAPIEEILLLGIFCLMDVHCSGCCLLTSGEVERFEAELVYRLCHSYNSTRKLTTPLPDRPCNSAYV